MKFATILTNAQTDGQIVSAYLFSAMQQEEQNNNGVTLRHDILMPAER